MADFAFAGSNNPTDAAGAGTPAVPPPQGIPSVAPPSVPGGFGPDTTDPRLALALQALQPKPQGPAWLEAIRRIAPILGGLAAMSNNAGGAFTSAWNQGLSSQALADDREAQTKMRLAEILHQQQQEQIQMAREARATKTIEAKAAQEQADKQDKLMRDEWNAQSQGGLIDTINNLIQTQGPEAADQYMAGTNIGSLTAAGVPHTVKDLVDRYAVRGPDGTLIGGKTKTPKETKAGTLEDWVARAESIAQAKTPGQRPLTDEESQAVDAAAIKQYKELSKDPESAELNKSLTRLEINIDNLRATQLKNTIDEQNASKTPIQPGTKEYGIARDLAYGVLSYPDFARMYAFQRAGREQMRQIYDLARTINPDFSPSLFEQGAKFAASPQTRRSLAAVANVESGVPSMIDASDAATRSGVKAFNQYFVVPGGVQMGDHVYSDLQAAHKAFADELSLALGVGTASDLKTKLGLDIADPNLSPSAFRSVLQNQVIPFLERRKMSLKGQMGPYGAGKASEMMPGDVGPQQSTKQPVPGLPGVTFSVRP